MKLPPKKGKRIIITKSPKKGKTPPGRALFGQIFLSLIIFFTFVSLYSFISDTSKNVEEIPLSTLAQEISLGNISSITVVGDRLDITFQDGVEKISKKESSTALTTTFSNYGVPIEALAKINIEVKDDRGFMYWFASLAPQPTWALFFRYVKIRSSVEKTVVERR